MALSQFREYNMRNIFFGKSYSRYCKKLAPGSFLKVKIEQNFIWANSMEHYKVCFYCMPKSSSFKIY